jgi:hypothetical protein
MTMTLGRGNGASALRRGARRMPGRRAARLIATVGLVLLSAAPAQAAPSSGIAPGTRWALSNSSVTALAAHGATLYAATASNTAGIGLRANAAGAFDPTSGELDTAWPELYRSGANAAVTAIVEDGAGGAYLAGSFDGANGIEQNGIVHLGSSHEVDLAFRPQVDGTKVEALARAADGTLYVAGRFTEIGGQPRDGIAALNGATGEVLAWRPRLNASSGTPEVRQLALAATGLYVAGKFASVGDPGASPQTRLGAAQLSLADGSALTWDPSPGEGATRISAMAVAGSRVYLAGAAGGFTTLGGVAARRLAAVDATTGAYDATWLPAPNNNVSALALSGDGQTVYAGGTFTAIGAQASQPTRNRVAAIDATTGEATSWDAGLSTSTSVLGLLRSGGTLYATGSFTAVAGTTRCGAAAFATTDAALQAWDPALGSTAGGNCTPLGGTTLALSGTRVWIGGTLTVANVRPRLGNLLAIDMSQDRLLDWAPSVRGGDINELAASADGSTLYLGGAFTSVNGVTRLRAAAVRSALGATDATILPTDVRAWDPAPNNTVNTLALSSADGTVYLGGSFTRVRGDTVDRLRLAAFEPGGDGLPTTWDPAADGVVRDLAVGDGVVFAAGSFDNAGTAARRRVAALSTAGTGSVLPWDAGFDPGVSQTVNDLALDGPNGVLYVAGGFESRVGTALDAPTRRNLVAMRVADAAVTSWAPEPSAAIDTVSVGGDGTVYLSGSSAFTIGPDAVARTRAAAVTAAGQVTSWAPPIEGTTADKILSVSGQLVVGGAWTRFGGLTQRGLLSFGTAVAPTILRAPELSVADSVFDGVASVDARLTCRVGDYAGTWPFQRTYRWLRDGEPIDGQTGATYVASGDDADAQVSCEETVDNGGGPLATQSGSVLVLTGVPEVDTPPELVGRAEVGQQVSSTTGVWRRSPADYEFRWLLDGNPIAGQTSSTLQVLAAYEGRQLTAEVVARNAAGPGAPASTAAVTVAAAPGDPEPRDPEPRGPEPRGPEPRDPAPRDPAPRGPEPRAPPARVAATLDIGKLKVDRRRGTLRIPVRASVRGTLTLTLTARQGRRRVVVARGRGRVARVGRTVMVTVRPTRAGRRALRARLRLRIAGSLRPFGGGAPVIARARAAARLS